MSAGGRARLVTTAPTAPGGSDAAQTVEPGTPIPSGHHSVVGQPMAADALGRRRVEVVVDGWRFDLVVEDAGRAELRARASRDRSTAVGTGGPLEVRAIIPGRIAAVAVTPGDTVEAEQTLLIVEAMKMQNELRAPRAGSVVRIAVGAGQTVELGDLLVVLE